MSSEFDFNKLQYVFRFRNYLQTPVPVVHVTAPEQVDQGQFSSSMSLGSGYSKDGTQTASDANPAWHGHPPEGTVVTFETEIFLPSYHYDEIGLEILVSDGDWRYVKERQTLYYRHRDMRPGAVHSILIKPVNVPAQLTSSSKKGAAIERVSVEGPDIQVQVGDHVNGSTAPVQRQQSAPVQRQQSGDKLTRVTSEDDPDRAACIIM